MTEDLIYTVAEAAGILKIGKNNVYSLIEAGVIPVLKLGGYKIRKSTLLEFVDKYEGYDLSDPKNIVLLSKSV